MTDFNYYEHFEDDSDFFQMFEGSHFEKEEYVSDFGDTWIGYVYDEDGSLTVQAEFEYDMDEQGLRLSSGEGRWV